MVVLQPMCWGTGQINLTTTLCLCWVPCKHNMIFEAPLDSYPTKAPTYLCLVEVPRAPNISWGPERLSFFLRPEETRIHSEAVSLLHSLRSWIALTLPVACNGWQFLHTDKWLFSSCEETESVSFSWDLAGCWLVLLVGFGVYLEFKQASVKRSTLLYFSDTYAFFLT